MSSKLASCQKTWQSQILKIIPILGTKNKIACTIVYSAGAGKKCYNANVQFKEI